MTNFNENSSVTKNQVTTNTEANLVNTQEIFSIFVEAVEDYAIFILDLDGNILSWNTGGRRLKGYEAHEVIGKNFRIFYTEKDIKRDHPAHELKLAAANGKYEEEGWRLKKDGTRFWANVIITALREKDGTLRGFGKVTRDLTQRRLAELRLAESEEKFRLLVSSVADYAIINLDPDGYITSWNTGAELITGYKAVEILGQHFTTFYQDVDKHAQKPEIELRTALRDGRFEDEGWRVRKDGTRFWANVVVTALFDENRRHLGFSKVTRDLSERKKSEETLRAAYDDLELRVALRTAELSEAKAKAEDAVRARDQFFSIASHELKTPLSSLKLQAQMRLRAVKKGDYSDFEKDKLIELCESDTRQVNRLAFLVDNMMDVSKLSSGNFNLNLERLDLNSLVFGVAKNLMALFSTSKNEYQIRSSGTVLGDWDRHRLEQVFTNILSNASKYAPGTLVEIVISRNEKEAVISIKDNGPGIPKENQEFIFSPFARLLHKDVSGLGLGLHVVKQIVEAHNGSVTVNSSLGQGAQFIVTLPINNTVKDQVPNET
jgi:PAS domain S-box-containing protein